MPARGPSIELQDFTGGLNTFDPEYSLNSNQSPDLDNVIILTKGFKKRNGDSAFNATVMGSSATAITGLGYIKFDSGVEYLNAVAGTKFYTSSGLTGTMADATGILTITSSASNIWNPVNFNNIQIWFGGAPDVPFKYTGSGNGTALGGTPPSAFTSFVTNNRVFALSTTANPSRIYWCVLNNPEDWAGATSGNADVNTSDGEPLLCGIVNGADSAVLFKNTSTHMMVTSRAPFPIYQLQKGIGACGRYAVVNANGTIYFITPSKRLRATKDGLNFVSFPKDIDNIFDTINTARMGQIYGYYNSSLEQVIFLVSTGSSTTNNYAIVWDIKNECFFRYTTGFKSNVASMVQGYRMFAGHYNGKAYEKFVSTTSSDASETSPGVIDGYLRTPFKNVGGLDDTAHPLYFTVSALNETSTVLELSYGFDYTSTQKTQNSSIVAVGSLWDVALWDVGVWGGQNAVNVRMYVTGRGNLFSLKIRNAVASQGFTVQGISIRNRTDKARKELTAI